jgi:hypothetical protein
MCARMRMRGRRSDTDLHEEAGSRREAGMTGEASDRVADCDGRADATLRRGSSRSSRHVTPRRGFSEGGVAADAERIGTADQPCALWTGMVLGLLDRAVARRGRTIGLGRRTEQVDMSDSGFYES